MTRIHCIDISDKPWASKLKLPPNFNLVSSFQALDKVPDQALVIVFADVSRMHDGLSAGIIQLLNKEEIHFILILNKSLSERSTIFELLNMGFKDVLIYDEIPDLAHYVEKRLERFQKIDSILNLPVVQKNLLGKAKKWKSFLREIIESAHFSKSNMLISGESGTGKELISRLIHTVDSRPEKGKLIIVDCTTLSKELAGSEFFGHEKGAYTNAIGSREGAFALADNGTLFLDEIGELPLPLQAELLRVIQEGTYKKLGSNEWKKTNFRLVCATNRDMRKMVEDGHFRFDLFYRISDVEINTIPLSERIQDIPILAESFIDEFRDEMQIAEKTTFSNDVLAYLMERDYPGNIRELKQLVKRILMKHPSGGRITLGDIPEKDRPLKLKQSSDNLSNEFESAIRKAIMNGKKLTQIKNLSSFLAIKLALEMEGNSQMKAAKLLDVTTRSIQQNLKRPQD